jgi:uncharacterized protein
VLLRHLLGDIPSQSERASSHIARVDAGELTVRTAETVIMETVFTLERTYKLPKTIIRRELLALFELPSFQLPGKHILAQVLDTYVELYLSFVDAYQTVMPRWGLDTTLTFDSGFDRVPGLKRIGP